MSKKKAAEAAPLCPVLVAIRDSLNSVSVALYAKSDAKKAKDDAAFKKAGEDLDIAAMELALNLRKLQQKYGEDGGRNLQVPDEFFAGLNPEARRLALAGIPQAAEDIDKDLGK